MRCEVFTYSYIQLVKRQFIMAVRVFEVYLATPVTPVLLVRAPKVVSLKLLVRNLLIATISLLRTLKTEFFDRTLYPNALILSDRASSATAWALIALSLVFCDAFLAEHLLALPAVSWLVDEVQADHACQAVVLGVVEVDHVFHFATFVTP